MNNMENLIAIIKNGIVENIAVGSDEWAASLNEETINVTGLGIGIGWSYNNGEFRTQDGKTIEENKAYLKLELEKSWRDLELEQTDFIVPLTDHPKHAAYLVYRQELRDYPQQADFPNGERPVKP